MVRYAVIKTGGKQYKVYQGSEILVDKIDGQKGEKISFDNVLLIVDGQKVKIGKPKVANGKVTGEIVNQEKGKKIRVVKFKAKSRYRRVKGFHPFLTRIKIERISY